MGSKTASSAGTMNGPRVSPQRPERDTRRVSDQTGWPTIECIRTGRDLNARTHRTSTCHREFYGTFTTRLLIVRALVSTVGRMTAETRRVE